MRFQVLMSTSTKVTAILVALMMEAVRISETSVNFYQTYQCNIAEDNFNPA
jgi:hypothetical protein